MEDGWTDDSWTGGGWQADLEGETQTDSNRVPMGTALGGVMTEGKAGELGTLGIVDDSEVNTTGISG